ncbi:MAG: hypothetical protein L6Q37_07065 [Bdellovibrionaceae bacterium]|nr:hypothetical protein [Pseudobdellovibrionaceae bacterium]NUM57158.1 hypothetical protein [Pseudobdellovibrionaceae bacterium]
MTKIIYSLFLSLAMVTTLSCGKSFNPDSDSEKGKIRVRLLTVDPLIPEKYKFEVIELLNIFDLTSLSGKFARFYTKAYKENDELKGIQPRAHFLKTKSGVFIPKDELSTNLASIYYHTQNLALWDQKIGAEKINTLPRKIILNTQINGKGYKDNNALYEGKTDAIIFLKYTDQDLPLALNAGVFAHEYFHSLFYKTIQLKINENPFFKKMDEKILALSKNSRSGVLNISMKPLLASTEFTNKGKSILAKTDLAQLTEDSVYDYFRVLLKGYNEGIADFWGWSYTNDINFISHSIKETPTNRTLELKSQNLERPALHSKSEILSSVFVISADPEVKEVYYNTLSYEIGTRVGLFYKELTNFVATNRKISLDEAKLEVSKSIFQLISGWGNDLANSQISLNYEDLPSPQDVLIKFSKTFMIKNAIECEFILNAIKFTTNNSTTTLNQIANSNTCIQNEIENKYEIKPKEND